MRQFVERSLRPTGSAVLVVATLFVCISLLDGTGRSAVSAVPAYAGGLAKPVVPLDISNLNPPAPSEPTASDLGCPPTDGTIPLYLPDPNSCSKYIVCSGSFAMQMECGPGMHFSAKTSSCTFPPLAGCSLLENSTETMSLTDLKGPPGIDATAYPMGIPSRDGMKSEPSGNAGQLPDVSFNSDAASATAAGPEPADMPQISGDPVDSKKPASGSFFAKIAGLIPG